LSDQFVVISGCSGGGKSTLLEDLRARGHPVIEEPGRRIVKHELQTGGRALPWIDAVAFARRAIEMALADRAAAQIRSGWVFFDRGLIDAASMLDNLIGEPVLERLGSLHRYHSRVFMAPPWPEIYVTDGERQHGFEAALLEYHRLQNVFAALGYEMITLPKATVSTRADFVLSALCA
jgi:predicted ATPase